MASVALASIAVRELLTDSAASPIWPPIGLTIGLVLIAPRAIRPVVVVGALLGEVLTDLDGFGSAAVPFLAADLVAIVLGVALIEWALTTDYRVERTAHALKFFAAAGIASAAAGAVSSLGVSTGKLSFFTMFTAGDALGIVAITPLFLIRSSDWISDSARFRSRELAAIVSAIAALTVGAFATTWPLSYLLVPTAMWVAIRFGATASGPLAAAIVLYASALTVAGFGPFTTDASSVDPLVQAQFFSASILLSTMLASAHARRANNERLRLGAVLQATPDLVTVVDEDEGVVAAWRPPGDPLLDVDRILSFSEADDGSTEVVRVPASDDQRERFFEIRAGEVRPGRFVKVARDVSHQRRASMALARSELRWRTMADAAFEGMVETDLDGRIVFVSDRFAEIRGIPVSEINGQYFGDVVSNVDWERSADLRERIRAGEPAQTEMAVTFGGDTRWTIISSHPLMDENGERRGSVIFFSETTDLHLAEARRRQVEADLALVEQRERAEIARAIHDGPLQQLVAVDIKLGLTARTYDTPAEVTEAQETVQDTIAKLRDTLRDLTPEDIAAGQLMTEMASFGRRLLVDSDTELTVVPMTSAPPLGNVALTLFQIGREALINAATHAEASMITISLVRDAEDFTLRIVDDGVGFPEGELPLSADGHFGIRTMLERASDAGGNCVIRPAPPRGTEVIVEIPIPRDG